jgi:hypothetical protein
MTLTKEKSINVAGLKARIEQCQQGKQELIDYLQGLKEKWIEREISYADYEREINEPKNGKTIQEWFDYYDSYIEECGKRLEDERKRSLKNKSIRIVSLIVLLGFVLGFLGYFLSNQVIVFLAPSLDNFTDVLDIVTNERLDYNWNIENLGEIESVKISGFILGEGNVRIYLEDKLILDSDNIIMTSGGITGGVTGFQIFNSTENNTSDEDGNESMVLSGQENETETNESLPPETNESLSNVTLPDGNVTLPDGNVTSPGNESDNRTIEVLMKEFLEYCEETCSGLGLNQTNYTLRIRIVGDAELHLDEIAYQIIMGEEGVPPTGRVKSEERIKRGKRVVVENTDTEEVKVSVNIPESWNVKSKEKLKLRKNGGDFEFKVIDSDDDGLIDGVEFLTSPGEEIIEIIVITKAEHLDTNRDFLSDIFEEVRERDGIWSEVIPDSEYVRVKFEKKLDFSNDITIWPRVISGKPRIEVYEADGTTLIVSFDSLINDSYNKVFLSGLNKKQDTFDLRIIGGSVEFDHIIDPAVGSGSRIVNSDRTFISGVGVNQNVLNWNKNNPIVYAIEVDTPGGDVRAGDTTSWYFIVDGGVRQALTSTSNPVKLISSADAGFNDDTAVTNSERRVNTACGTFVVSLNEHESSGVLTAKDRFRKDDCSETQASVDLSGLSGGEVVEFEIDQERTGGGSHDTIRGLAQVHITGNQAPIVTITSVDSDNVVDYTNPGGMNPVEIIFDVVDSDGLPSNELDPSTLFISYFLNAGGESVSTTGDGGCGFVDNANVRTYTCTVDMNYWNDGGDWTASVSIDDNAGTTGQDIHFFFVNSLLDIEFMDAPISFGVVDVGQKVPTSVTIRNNGNVEVPAENGLEVTSGELGSLTVLDTISSSQFRVGGTPVADACITGAILSDASNTPVTATLGRGDGTGQNNEETLTFCLDVPSVAQADYSAVNGGGAWRVTILIVPLAIGRKSGRRRPFDRTDEVDRKKKKKKSREKIKDDKLVKALNLMTEELREKYKLSEKEIIEALGLSGKGNIPVNIFSKKLGGLEALCKYMKENLGMSYHGIALDLNRDDRTIWTAVKKASEKLEGRIKIERGAISVPAEIFKNRKLTVLEAIIVYLKGEEKKNKEIATLLERDARNIQTIYSRAVKKIGRKI